MNNHRGFTLIEIAIVMIIIGLLAGGGVSLMGVLSKRKARNECTDYMKQVKEALISYADITGALPWADTDNPPDGRPNLNAPSGTLPFLFGDVACTMPLGLPATDSWLRNLRYEINAGLATDRATSCFTLRAGLSGNPQVVDADGSPAAFSVAVVLVSAGPMDADGDSNNFDDISGTPGGDNTDGNPNYIRHSPSTVPGNEFDDLVLYVSGGELFQAIGCGTRPIVTIDNTSVSNVYLHDITSSQYKGLIQAGKVESFDVEWNHTIEITSNIVYSPLDHVNSIPNTPLPISTTTGITVP